MPSPGNQPLWTISADKITYNKNDNIYNASGDVVIQNAGKKLTADNVRFNYTSMEAQASGNVKLVANGDSLTGDEVTINLNSGTGMITNGRIFIEKKHFIIKGDKIVKTGRSTYAMNRGSLTTCDGDSPAWKITGRDLKVTLEDYGSVKNSTLWVKKIPIAYIPYLLFPVKINRQSGLLPPQFGYTDRNGFQYDQPFYWAINRSSDATFYFNPIQKRGDKFGGEFRYVLDTTSKGTLMMDSLNDRKVDDGTDDTSDKWGFSGDNALRPNHDRYWFRMKADQSMPLDFTAKLDLDIVSDQDYLREFSDGYTGYNQTEKYFVSQFGRDIDDKNDPIRENDLNINRTWTNYSFTTEVIWNDNVINRRQKDKDPTLQQLPDVQFLGIKHSLWENLLYGDLNSQYVYFYRKDGETAHRGDIHPRLYLPMHYKQYLAFEPSIGFRQTAWYVDRKDPNLQDIEAHQNRELYDVKGDLSTDLFKIFDYNGESIDKIKHTIVPKIGYEYIPDLNQSEIPQFDNIDDIKPRSLMTLSLTNIITTKEKVEKDSDQTKKYKQSDSLYNQAFRFLIEQPYDFNKIHQSGETPYEPLYAEMDISPSKFVTVGTQTQWSHDKGKLISNSIFTNLMDLRGDRLYVEHFYMRNEIQSIYLNFTTAVTSSISLTGDYEYNLKDKQDITKSIGGIYKAQCWSVEIGVINEDNDKKFNFMVNLNGIADIGSGL